MSESTTSGGGEATRVPPKGSEERAFWLEAATFHGFEQTYGGEEIPEYDPPAYFATESEVLALMAACRDQGRRDAALAAQPAPVREGVDTGWKLVPEKPTAEMMAVGGDEIERSLFANGDTNDTVFDCAGRAYQHMLWAAPPVPEPVAPEAGEDLAALSAALDRAVKTLTFVRDAGGPNHHRGSATRPQMREAAQDALDEIAAYRSCRLLPAPTQPAAQGEPVAWAYEYGTSSGAWYSSAHCIAPTAKLFPFGLRNVRPLYEAPHPAAIGRPGAEEIAREIRLWLVRGHMGSEVAPSEIADLTQAILALIAPDRGDGTRADGDGWRPISELPPQTNAVLGRWARAGDNPDGTPYYYWQRATGRYFDFKGERHWCLEGSQSFGSGPFYGELPTHFLAIPLPPAPVETNGTGGGR